MENLIILSCHTSLELLFAFFGGVILIIVVALILRAREQSLMREVSDLKKLSYFIQRYYWLMNRGKITEAQKKALKKTVSIFANRIINADRSSVEIALQSFGNGVFSGFKQKVEVIHLSYKNQFVKMPSMGYDSETSTDFFTVEDIVTPEEAVNQIENAFEEVIVK